MSKGYVTSLLILPYFAANYCTKHPMGPDFGAGDLVGDPAVNRDDKEVPKWGDAPHLPAGFGQGIKVVLEESRNQWLKHGDDWVCDHDDHEKDIDIRVLDKQEQEGDVL